MSSLPPALIVGAGGGELPAVRSLGSRGAPVWLAGPQRVAAAASRYARGFFTTPGPLEAPRDFVERLVELARGFEEAPVLVPVDDAAVEALATGAERLGAAFRLTGPPPRVALEILDKARQYERVRTAGIPLPATWIPEGPDAAARIGAAATFPLLVKPRSAQRFRARRGFKVVRVGTPIELEAALVAFGEPMVVQEVVPGGVERIYEYGAFVDREGRVRVEAVMRKLEEDPDPFGSAIAAEAVPGPALEALGRRVLEAFAYRGTAHAEFKHDPRDGRFLFIELNARMPISASLQRAAGADTIWPIYAQAAGLPLELATRASRRVVWLRPELRLSRGHRVRLPRRSPDSPRGPTRYVADLFDPRDPAPLLAEAAAALRRRLRPPQRSPPSP